VVTSQAELLRTVAAERVQHEWERILASPAWAVGLNVGLRLGTLQPTLGRARALPTVDAVAASAETDPVARLAALLVDLAEAAGGVAEAAERLIRGRWPTRVVRQAARAANWSLTLAEREDEELAAWSLEDPEAAGITSRLGEAVLPEPEAERARRLGGLATRGAERRWVRGADLLEWGQAPGPELGRLLQRVWIGELLGRWPDARACRAEVRAGLGTERGA